jgi:phage/conjugal plasmid C-4 type zinc finger TraR family protein
MAGGWSKDGAVQDQMDASLAEAVELARSRLHHGPSASECAECGATIPEARRVAIAGVHYCIACQTVMDQQPLLVGGYNRRGSKDSQLR